MGRTGSAVASADRLATRAGMAVLGRGGNAVDAAIATNAVLAVTSPHLCGMGGDLFALVAADGQVACLNASGRAGHAASADLLRAEGLAEMPFRHDVRSVTVPGCVDGWISLHQRFAALPLGELFAEAIRLAEDGFPASPLLVGSLATLDERGSQKLAELAGQATSSGMPVRRPGVGRTLRAIAAGGRDGFYGGEFGDGLLSLGGGWFNAADLGTAQCEWVTPLAADAWGVRLWTAPPNSQGYLLLASAVLAERTGVPTDADSAAWAHLLIECATAAGFDRPQRLFDGADGQALVAEIAGRTAMVDTERASVRRPPVSDGDTTYLCTADATGMAVSLIQSNASGFGSWLAEPNTSINLHNRGMGFSLEPGHPGELRPGRRPPHTLAPALATRDGAVAAVFGTMGGDAQPQILLQVAARLFAHGQSATQAVDAARWALRGPLTGFDTWTAAQGYSVVVESGAPTGWPAELRSRGHDAHPASPTDGFGHAHAIVRTATGWDAAADPRAVVGEAATSH